MWPFTTVLAGSSHSTRTVKTTRTRSPPWICAQPHPSQQWQPQRVPPGLPTSASPCLQHFLSFPESHIGLCLHISFQLIPGIVLPKLYLTLYPNELVLSGDWEHTSCSTVHHLTIQRLSVSGQSFRLREQIARAIIIINTQDNPSAIWLVLVHFTTKEIKLREFRLHDVPKTRSPCFLNWTVKSQWKA